MKQPKRIPGPTEKRVGYYILALLVLIAAGHAFARFRLDPSAPPIMADFSPDQISAAGRIQEDLSTYAPPSVRPMTAQETFTADTLYEKIDGKAEVYLPAGFRELAARRFAYGDAPDDWFEVFEYRMADAAGAFAVYTLQKREDAEEVGFGVRHGYRSGQALFFIHGSYYIEIIAASGHPEVLTAMDAWAQQYIYAKTVEETGEVRGPEMFPKDSLDPESITLLITDAFGFDRLDNVFTALYHLDGAHVMGFLSLRKDAGEARALSDAYRQFLLDNGGKSEPGPDIPGAWAIDFYDTCTVVFTRGPYLAGIHMAEDRKAAMHVIEKLARNLDEKSQ